MRSLIARVVALSLAAAGLLILAPAPSYADTVCQVTDPETGVCLIYVEVPGNLGDPGDQGDDGPKDTGSGSACYWSGTSPPPGPVPCTSDAGYWVNSVACYITLADPQPPPGSPFWEGTYQDGGAVYVCTQPQTNTVTLIWFANPPPPSGGGPTPRQVAELAIEQMDLRAIDIGITPEPGEDSIGIVGMPVWMWAANPDEHTVGPITESASAGGITVTATATLHKITWDMGDGTEVTCTGAGTAYKPSYGRAKSPDCGHTYEKSSSKKPDGKYTVTATSDWVITWEGAGQTGTIRLNGLTRSTAISVGEAQVLVQ